MNSDYWLRKVMRHMWNHTPSRVPDVGNITMSWKQTGSAWGGWYVFPIIETTAGWSIAFSPGGCQWTRKIFPTQLTLISSCTASRQLQQRGQQGGDQRRCPQWALPDHSPFLCFHLQQRRKAHAIIDNAKDFWKEINLVIISY